jgi:peptidoglycan L-alanyl-D-glutamate endopeptidase CwlK
MEEILKNFKAIYSFGRFSRKKLDTCHPDLILILETAIAISNVDFGVSEGERTQEKQNEYYQQGRTKPGPIITWIDGYTKKGKHNYDPSMAADYYAFVNGKISYNLEALSYLAGLFHAVAEVLYAAGKITHKIRWGGNWDMDGEILTDQTFDDRPHVELIKVNK